MAVELIRAWNQDIDRYIELEKRVGAKSDPKIYEPTTDRSEVEQFFRACIVRFISYENRTVGVIAHEKKSSSHIFISDFAVDPDFWRRRIGLTALQKALADWRFIHCVDLVTHPDNRAMRLYLRVGFTLDRIIPNYYGDRQPRARMIWTNRNQP